MGLSFGRHLFFWQRQSPLTISLLAQQADSFVARLACDSLPACRFIIGGEREAHRIVETQAEAYATAGGPLRKGGPYNTQDFLFEAEHFFDWPQRRCRKRRSRRRRDPALEMICRENEWRALPLRPVSLLLMQHSPFEHGPTVKTVTA